MIPVNVSPHRSISLPALLVIYEGAAPEAAVPGSLTAFDVKALPVHLLEHAFMQAELESYALVIVSTATSLSRGLALSTRIRMLTSAPLLLLAPSRPLQEAYGALCETVDILLPPDTETPIVAGHAAALLRHQAHANGQEAKPQPSIIYRDQLLEIDVEQRSVLVDGRHVQLTPTEFRLLVYMAQRPGVLLTYQQILHSVWGWDASEHRIVHTFAAQLRTKLGERVAPYLLNEYGSGYRFSPPA
jgi:two-component system KDP operon response regulator KdpE